MNVRRHGERSDAKPTKTLKLGSTSTMQVGKVFFAISMGNNILMGKSKVFIIGDLESQSNQPLNSVSPDRSLRTPLEMRCPIHLS